jgi:hypothetical protein
LAAKEEGRKKEKMKKKKWAEGGREGVEKNNSVKQAL